MQEAFCTVTKTNRSLHKANHIVYLSNPIVHKPDNQQIKKLKFIYFTSIDKRVLQLIFIFFIGKDVSSRGSSMCKEHTEKTCMSKRATTIPFYIQPLPIMGIELGLQRWEASTLFNTLLGHAIKCLSESNPMMLDYIEDGTSRNI